MKTIGVGVDIVKNKRIQSSLKNRNFIDRTFSRQKSFFTKGCVAHVSMAVPVCDRLSTLSKEVLDYLVIRMERSLEEAFRLVARLDAVALSENNSITVALASRVLRNVLERN